jgi:hypothetical protein
VFTNEISTESTIDASPHEVWAVLTDFPSYPAWHPTMTVSDGGATVGSRPTIRFTPRGRRPITMRPTIIVADPDRELRWLGRLLLPRLFDGEHIFTIEEAAPDRVRFVQAERFRGLLVPFLRRLIEVDTPDDFRRTNEALASRVATLRSGAA